MGSALQLKGTYATPSAGALGILCVLSGAALAAGTAPETTRCTRAGSTPHVSPAQNFYQYANGGWRKSHPIPAAYSSWSTFNILQIRNEKIIRQLIQNAAKAHAPPGSAAQKVGDFYASGMDEKLIDRVGVGAALPGVRRHLQHAELSRICSGRSPTCR